MKKVKVSGLLLYAVRSDFTLKEPIKFTIIENNYCADCLNLNRDFTIIKAKLDDIAVNFVQKE